MSSPRSPRSPGVLESSANLDDAIKTASRNPARIATEDGKQQLFEAYLLAGHAAAQTALDRCMRIMKDTNEDVPAKLVAVRVLNMLMELNNDQLAQAIVPQLKFFTGIAKKSKEKEKKKKRPHGMFSSRSSDAEVTQFVTAICELMDKWGRHYASAPPGSSVYSIAKARQDLLADRAKLPIGPEAYRFIDTATGGSGGGGGMGFGGSPAAGMGAFGGAGGFGGGCGGCGGFGGDGGGGGPRGGGGGGGLDEGTLGRLAQEAMATLQRSGPQSAAAAEATSVFEAELQKWRQAVETAADHGDFAEVERLSEVTHRFAEIKDGIESSATPSAATSRSASVSASTSAPATPRDSVSPPPSGRKSRKKDKNLGGGTAGGGGVWAGAHVDAAGWNFGGDMGGCGASYPPPSSSCGGTYPPGSGPGGFPGGGSCFAGGHLPEGGGPGGGGDGTLQAQLERALRRVRELEPLQLELTDARATVQALREANAQLQQEVDACHKELREARRQVGLAEDKLREKEEVISQTRQRLFESKQKGAKMEEDIKEQSEVQNALQGRLQSARQQTMVTENELRTLRSAIGSASERQLPRTEGLTPPTGNVSYGRSDRSLGSSLELSSLSAQAAGMLSHQKVNDHDELAGARGGSPRQESLDATDLPLQQLARQSRTINGSNVGGGFPGGGGPPMSTGDLQESMRPPPPTIARSSAEAWSRTSRVGRLPGVLLSQPPPSPEVLEATQANFRNLLMQSHGLLYEDSRVRVEVSISGPSTSSTGGRPHLLFELAVSNCSSNSIQEVHIKALEPARTHVCELMVVEQPQEHRPGGGGGPLWRTQSLRYAGRLDVFGPFEAVPPIELAFLLPDGLASRVRLRLPLVVTRMMAPPNAPPDPRAVVELWESPDFAHAEVTFACAVRPALLGPGAPFTVWRCLELGGAFRVLPGLDENPRGALLASGYPQRQGTPQEVLIRAELGGAGGPGGQPYGLSGTSLPYGEASLCRVAVRSASHQVNRAVAQVALEMLIDPSSSNGGFVGST